MATRKNSSAKLKKRNSTIAVIITCLVVLLFVIVGVSVAFSGEETSGDVDTTVPTSTEVNITKSTTTEPNLTEKETTSKTAKNESESETEPTTAKKPTSTGSFYDSVKYRSPDAGYHMDWSAPSLPEKFMPLEL